MNILYLLLGLFAGLYLNSFVTNLIQTVTLKILVKHPDLLEKWVNKENEVDVMRKKASKFQERINEAMAKSKQNL